MARSRKKKGQEVESTAAESPAAVPEAAPPEPEGPGLEDEVGEGLQELREEGSAVGEGMTELLGFMLADEEYALDILEIKEIIRLQTITPVPRTPDYLKGIITLRGVIVPVFDLRSRLGLKEAEHGPHTRIVVVYRGDEFAGMIVDSITQVMRVGVERIEPPPTTIGTVEAEFIKGVTRHQERLIILLNLARVLDVRS
jgi:purine-binding chemotaxis protein CheW